ncbi:MAG TPA: transposase, partial [Ktedonobacterales bacterium]|nr:transposase [Ktedonobacterales bacterium]
YGWVYGWKLHLVITVGQIWLPLAAELTPATVADNEEAVLLLDASREGALFVPGDLSYQDVELAKQCAAHQRTLVTPRRGRHPHRDDGVEVRQLFHQLRTHAIENFNGQFKSIFDCSRPVPTKGFVATQRYVLGAVLVYQLALLYRFQIGGSLRAGLKPLLQAA